MFWGQMEVIDIGFYKFIEFFVRNVLFGARSEKEKGLGRLASQLCSDIGDLRPISEVESISPGDVVVFAESTQERLRAVLNSCEKLGNSLVMLSTGMDDLLPVEPNFLLLKCPNVSFEVLDFMSDIKSLIKSKPGGRIFIREHHQPQKRDISGTAVKIMSDNNGDLADIESVRSLEQTRALGFDVPEEYVDGYAIHEIWYERNGVRESLGSLIVMGRRTYSEGLEKLLALVGEGISDEIGNFFLQDWIQGREHIH